MALLSRKTVATLLERTGLRAALGMVPTWHGLLTLNYHRIGDSAAAPFDRGVFSATPEEFDAQMRFLRKNFDVVRGSDLETLHHQSRGRYVLITFDDGYQDNYESAFPVLRSHQVPAVLFITTSFLDRRRLSWWDEIAWMVRVSRATRIPGNGWLEASVGFDEPDRKGAIHALLTRYKSLPGDKTEAFVNYLAEATGAGRSKHAPGDLWMTWDMVRQMQAGGIEIGAHTVHHPVMANLSKERQAEEIDESIHRIAEETGARPTMFSYPAGKLGKFNEDTQACLKDARVSLAFSHYGGYCRFDSWDPYDIRRTPVDPSMGGAMFRALASLPQVFA